MNFRNWFEDLERIKEVPPNPHTKSIWVKDPNNQQQIDAWKNKNTHHVYKLPIEKERFVHFSLKENIPSIINKQEISGEWSIFAVSLTYGIWFPVVQYNHIIRKKGNYLTPSELSSKKLTQRLTTKGCELPRRL